MFGASNSQCLSPNEGSPPQNNIISRIQSGTPVFPAR